MVRVTVASESINNFFVRLRRTPGEYWYLPNDFDIQMNIKKRQRIPDDLKKQDFLIDQIKFVNKQVFYHFMSGSLSGWLPKKLIKSTFRRIDLEPIKQPTPISNDNTIAAVEMMLSTKKSSPSMLAIEQKVTEYGDDLFNLLEISDLIIEQFHSIKNLNQVNFRQINSQLKRSKPVLMRVCGLDNLKSSLIVIVGFNKKLYYYNNPWTGKLESISKKKLINYLPDGHIEAVSY